MLKQTFSIVTPITAAVAAAIPSAPLQLLIGGKQKEKNDGGRQTKKRNDASRFIAINAIKKKDNNKEKAKARIPAKAAIAIAAATFKAGNIYEDNA